MQAKGRVERAHLTLQDRLVKELRLRDIDTIEAANAYVPSFIAAQTDYLTRLSGNDYTRRTAAFDARCRYTWL